MAFSIYDSIDPLELTATLRLLPENPNYLLNRFLPDVTSQQIGFSIRDFERFNDAAKFRAYDAPVPLGRRPGFVRRQGELPALGRGYLLGEYARLLQEQLRGADDSGIAVGTDEDARNGAAEVRTRMELARGEVLSTGTFSLTDEEGLTLDADFGVPAAQINVAPAVLWSNRATATIVDDISGWTDAVEDSSGERPRFIMAGRAVIGDVVSNQGLREQFANLVGAIPDQLGIDDVNRVLDRRDLPTFASTADGRSIRPSRVFVDGVSTDTYPTDKVTLLPDQSIGQTRWGPTVEALELAQSHGLALAETPGIVGLVLKSANPAQMLTVVNAVGLPLIERPKAMLVADVR